MGCCGGVRTTSVNCLRGVPMSRKSWTTRSTRAPTNHIINKIPTVAAFPFSINMINNLTLTNC